MPNPEAAEYEYDYGRLPHVPMLKRLPKPERLTVAYNATWWQMGVRMIFGNLVPSLPRWLWPKRYPIDWARVWVADPPAPVVQTWSTDVEFARQRVAGMNPLLIRRVGELSAIPLDVQNQLDRPLLARLTASALDLAELVAAARVFVCDYRDLDKLGLVAGRHFVAPIAWFVWRDAVADEPAHLMPLAIKLGQHASAPVFVPTPIGAAAGAGPAAEGAVAPATVLASRRWALAKYFVQVADTVYGDMWAHLVQSHFVAAPFVVATKRHLGPQHPIRACLEPHMQFTLSVNDQFLGGSAQGLYKSVMPFPPASQQALINRAYEAWRFDDAAVLRSLQARGLADPGVLPGGYPFRDDMLVLHPILAAFAERLVQLHYRSDEAVRADAALMAWQADLLDTGPQGGHVAGMAPIATRARLAEVVTQLLVHFGPGHAAVHSPAADFAIFAPNGSNAAYRPVDELSGPAPHFVDFLPGVFKTLGSFLLHYAISEVRWGSFSLYGPAMDPSTRTLAHLANRMLVEAEAELVARNAARRAAWDMDYPYLVPSKIPNSIYA